jgi:hypothetical protein
MENQKDRIYMKWGNVAILKTWGFKIKKGDLTNATCWATIGYVGYPLSLYPFN